MSNKPMTSAQWIAQAEKFGVPHRVLPSFRDVESGRDRETGSWFGPVYGGMVHHTGSDGSDNSNRDLIVRGRSDLPGPLAHCGLNDDGTLDFITCGRANHAGGGDPRVLEAVRRENYDKYPPHTTKHNNEPGAVDGNDAFYGLEAYYFKSLSKPMYRTMVGWGAMICDFHGWTAKSMIAHREWSDYKIDPAGVDMHVYRLDVDARMKEVNAALRGPKLLTPNITYAIRAGINYQRKLEAITAKSAQSDVKAAIGEVKKQRQALRDLERKE